MNRKALQLCSRFALAPNELGFCGTDTAPAIFKKCITQGKCEKVEAELEKFIVLNPYLQTIADVTGKDKFSYEVIEAYWLGNDLLRQIKPSDYKILIKNLRSQGVPELLIKGIEDTGPEKFIPMHLFNILHVGVGKASGSVPFNLDSINQCMVRWGEILEKSAKSAQIKLVSLDKDWKIREEIVDITIEPKLTPKLQVGDSVAVHWGYVAKILSDTELTNLIIWTNQLLHSLAQS